MSWRPDELDERLYSILRDRHEQLASAFAWTGNLVSQTWSMNPWIRFSSEYLDCEIRWTRVVASRLRALEVRGLVERLKATRPNPSRDYPSDSLGPARWRLR